MYIKKLSITLAKIGVKKSGEQCRSKVKTFRTEYKKIKDNHNLTGRGRTEWKFNDCLNEILDTRPAPRPPVVLVTLDDATLQAKGHSEVSDEEEDVASNEKSVGNADDSSVVDISEVEEPESGRSSRSSTPASNATAIRKKKSKRSKGEVIIQGTKDNNRGLERKQQDVSGARGERMKFEEQQKREDRQFQLQIVQLLEGSARPPHPPIDHHSQYYHPYPADYPPYNSHSKYYDTPRDAENS